MPSARKTRLLVLLVIAAALAASFASGAHRYFTFENIKAQQGALVGWYRAHPAQTVASFFLLYVAVTSVSIPFAAVLTLVAGAIFWFYLGPLFGSFRAALCATIAFLISRFV